MTQKVLFELDGWCIHKWNIYKGSFVRHSSCDTHLEKDMLNDNPCCPDCDAEVPKEIITLWTMDNWNQIQTGNWLGLEDK